MADWKPEETPDCCEAWPMIATRLDWVRYEDYPEFLSMPHLKVGGHLWRVNHCPSCGTEVRDINMKRERLIALTEGE